MCQPVNPVNSGPFFRRNLFLLAALGKINENTTNEVYVNPPFTTCEG